jgi:hypothetical protein
MCGEDFGGVYEGELVRTTAGAWITKPPARCPNGHAFGPQQALVGYQACSGPQRRPHHLDLSHL